MTVNTINDLVALLDQAEQDVTVLGAIANDTATETGSGISAGLVTTRDGGNVKNVQKVIADIENGITTGVRADIQADGVMVFAGAATWNFVGSNITVTDVSGVATIAVASEVNVVGTPASNQLGVWTGTQGLEGTSALTYEAGVLNVTGTVAATDFTGDGTALTGVASTAQGALADTALQSADIGVSIQAYAAVLTATTAAYTTAAETKLNNVETSATADQTGAEIKTAYEAEADTNALTDALLTKLNVVETSAFGVIAESKAITAVDGLAYSTSLDSDGGAWIDGAIARRSSWYNEPLNTATRGATRAFPANPVVIAESGKVTIFDGDDPALPMWMVFNANGAIASSGILPLTDITSVDMTDGVLAVGQVNTGNRGGLKVISFLADAAENYGYLPLTYGEFLGTIADRNTVNGYGASSRSVTLVNSVVNDVAMTVLPNAPIDPATGIRVPTILVGTDGGMSQISDDGNVWDFASVSSTYNYCHAVSVRDDGKFVVEMDANVNRRYTHVIDALTADLLINSYGSSAESLEFYSDNSSLPGLHTLAESARYVAKDALAGANGLTRTISGTTKENGMVSYVTSTYNTGWMQGDIKGAWLSSVDSTDLVGAELVTNGDFATDISGWPDLSEGTGSIAWDASGYIGLSTGVDSSNEGRTGQEVSTTVGGLYTLHITRVSGSSYITVGETISGPVITATSIAASDAEETLTFTATTTSTYVTLRNFTNTNATSLIDSISVRLADADRSVNANGLATYGTVTKAAVATGAELMSYSGFSTANYLEQPYNADLDFGTGDFSIMGWVKPSATQTGQDYIFGRGTTKLALGYVASSRTWHIYVNGVLATVVHDITGVWKSFTLARSGTTVSLYVGGLLITSYTNAGDVSGSTPTLVVGNLVAGNSQAFSGGSIALLRISATAPSAAQIAKIYNDEKHLFTDNALAVLSADAVTALSHDPVTDLLYVGGASGTATVSGITPVSRDATAVSTFISVVDGMEIKQ